VATATSSSATNSPTGSTLTTTSKAATTNSPVQPSSGFGLSLSASPTAGSVYQGQSLTTDVLVSVVGTSQPVSLSVAGLPTGVTASFSPQNRSGTFSSSLILTTSASTPPGVYTVVVAATPAQVAKPTIATYQLTVTAAPVVAHAVDIAATPSQGGTTSPPPGQYAFAADRPVSVEALPAPGWTFSHWTVNGVSAGNGTSLSLIPTGNISILASFSMTTQAHTLSALRTADVQISESGATAGNVTIDGSETSLPASFNWTVGSSHEVTAPAAITAEGSVLDFTGWHGSLNSSSPSASFIVTGAMNFSASYVQRFLVNFRFTGYDGTPATVQYATFSSKGGSPVTLVGGAPQWLIPGSTYTFENAWVLGVEVGSTANGTSFVISAPANVTIPLQLYPVSLRLTDVFNQPLQAATVTLSTQSGQTLTKSTDQNGVVYFADVPLGWYEAQYSFMGVPGQVSDHSVGPHTVAATVVLSYPVAAVGAVMAISLAGAGIGARRRRNAE